MEKGPSCNRLALAFVLVLMITTSASGFQASDAVSSSNLITFFMVYFKSFISSKSQEGLGKAVAGIFKDRMAWREPMAKSRCSVLTFEISQDVVREMVKLIVYGRSCYS